MESNRSTKSIVITGCSSGFGRVTALHLARKGWRVLATVRKASDQQNLLDEWQSERGNGELIPIVCDLLKDEQVTDLRRVVANVTPRLDALLNNAGTVFPGPLETLPLRDLRAQLEINTVAHIAVTQALLPLLKAARGMILNVSSMGGRVAFPITGPYHASKFALEALSDALRIELAPFGVRVVVLEPGGSYTSIWGKGETQGQVVDDSPSNAYRGLLESYMQISRRTAEGGFPPQRFAELVERVLATPHPRARYPLGRWVGSVITLRRLLPDWVWDAWVRRMYRR